MALKTVGSVWIWEHFNLKKHHLTHDSYRGSNESVELNRQGEVSQIYGIKYAPESDTALAYVIFLLKYGDLDLSFLKAIFNQINPKEIINFIGDETRPYNDLCQGLVYTPSANHLLLPQLVFKLILHNFYHPTNLSIR